MRQEDPAEGEAPVGDGGRIAKWRRLALSAAVRLVDTLSAFLLRLRNRLESAPGDEDGSGDDRRRLQPRPAEAAASRLLAPAKPRRLVRFLVFLLLLITGTFAGAVFSWRLLSTTMNSNSAMVENLRDELAQMKKQAARDLRQIEKSRQMVRDYDKTVVGYLKEVEDSRSQVEELRRRLDAVKGVRGESPSQTGRGSPPVAAAAKRATPRKSGTCTMDSAQDAANLASCIEEFNRR